uniref:CSON002187 protein n=1 Tax=Culicoides sonorensis TaxID=179676 RepID=A0A336KYN4_CULSO
MKRSVNNQIRKLYVRSPLSLRSMEASRKDNKRYSRITSDDNLLTFDKIFLNNFDDKLRDKRAVGSDGNHTINLSQHNISDTSLSEFLTEITSPSQVTGLNLSNNHLTQLNTNAFAQLPHLSALDVSKNQLSTIDDAVELMKLTTLNVSHNNLYKFATMGANNHNNHTSSSNSNSSSMIQILDLSCNKFNSSRNIVLYNLNNLQLLDLSCNQLATIDRNLFFNLSQLQNLDLSYNQLSLLESDTFIYLSQLQILNLSNNNISFIQNDTFMALVMLEYLDVSNNFIRVESIHALQGIPDLVALSIANNEELSDSLQGFVATWSLKELDGSGTGLCHVPAALTQSVRILKLADNYLEVIRCGDLDSYPLLQHLILSFNDISEIEDDALGRLEIIETLYLDNNKLKRIPLSLPSSLIDLHLENNLITDIQPQALAGLKTLALLNLSHNKIIYLPGLPLPRLSRLNMRFCELESVNQELVKMSPYLRDLYLEGNPIKCADLLGIAEWATPCRENGETAESIDVGTANDYLVKWQHASIEHECNGRKKMEQKGKRMKNKVCKEVIRDAMPKNNVIRASTTATVPKINDNNYSSGNKGSHHGTDDVVANNKLNERQSSLNRQQKNQTKSDKNVKDKFESSDIIIGKNNRSDDETVTMAMKNNNVININETKEEKSTEQTLTSSANITRSYNNNNNIKTNKMATFEQKVDKKNVVDNQIVDKNLIPNIITTSTMKTTTGDNIINKNQINEKVQTNDVNHPIKLSKHKKTTKNWTEKQLKQQQRLMSDHIINMSQSYNNVMKSKTKAVAITNDDDYLNDDNKAVVDNFATVSSENVEEEMKIKEKEKSLEAKQLSLQLTNFNFTTTHPVSRPKTKTDDDNKNNKKVLHKQQSLSSTITAKPYSYQTETVILTTTTSQNNKINLAKHSQLNEKVNVLQQDIHLVGDHMKYPQVLPQYDGDFNTHNSKSSTLNSILNNNQVENSDTPQKQEWADIRDDKINPSGQSSTSYLGHPGLFMVIGATIGITIAFGFVHLYRCQKYRLWQHSHSSHHDDVGMDSISDISTINTPTRNYYCRHHNYHQREQQHHQDDLLPMDILNNKCHHMTTNLTSFSSTSMNTVPNSPIELW